MYLRKLKLKNFKLLRDVEIDFTRDDEPRPFTVFVGENGLCKTSLLEAIALAASGPDLANKLTQPLGYIDLRQPKQHVYVDAEFSFSVDHHRHRIYPGITETGIELPSPPQLLSTIEIAPGLDLFLGSSEYFVDGARWMPESRKPVKGSKVERRAAQSVQMLERRIDPLGVARGRHINHWFVAAYGIGRNLPMPGGVNQEQVSRPSLHRLLPLFETYRPIVGTGFADLLPNGKSAAFRDSLQQAFVNCGILPPRTQSLSLEAISGANNAVDRFMAHHLTFDGPRGELDIPTVWLSQGYQATMAWVADLVGQVWWEAEKQAVPLDDMEGICLIDEIDLHLHPLWQVNLVAALKKAFPKIQFIATTHSPMVLPGLREDEIIRLEQDDEGNVISKLPKIAPALKTGTELYSDFFDINRLEPVALDDALVRYGGLASYAARSEAEDKEARKLLIFLREHEIEPGLEPVPREIERPKPMRSSKPKKKAASR